MMIKLFNRPGLSFNILLVFICILAIGVGFLVGNYLLQVISGGDRDLETLNKQQVDHEKIAQDYSDDFEVKDVEQPVEQSPVDSVKENENPEVFVVQVGAFSSEQNASNLREELIKMGYNAYVVGKNPYKVQVGAFSSRTEAARLEKELEDEGYIDAFVTN